MLEMFDAYAFLYENCVLQAIPHAFVFLQSVSKWMCYPNYFETLWYAHKLLLCIIIRINHVEMDVEVI